MTFLDWSLKGESLRWFFPCVVCPRQHMEIILPDDIIPILFRKLVQQTTILNIHCLLPFSSCVRQMNWELSQSSSIRCSEGLQYVMYFMNFTLNATCWCYNINKECIENMWLQSFFARQRLRPSRNPLLKFSESAQKFNYVVKATHTLRIWSEMVNSTMLCTHLLSGHQIKSFSMYHFGAKICR